MRLMPAPTVSPLDRLPPAAAAPECPDVPAVPTAPPAAPLFNAPPDVTSLALPFTVPETDMASRTLRFYRLLRVRIHEGLLVLRRAARTG